LVHVGLWQNLNLEFAQKFLQTQQKRVFEKLMGQTVCQRRNIHFPFKLIEVEKIKSSPLVPSVPYKLVGKTKAGV
jgi:hypothetical protein